MLGFREINALEKCIRWSLKSENGTHGLRNLKFGPIRTDILYQASSKQVEVESNLPYTLIINGKKYRIKAGKNTLHAIQPE